ncbi:hypothetical protein [Streptomyces sp. SD15]
MRPTPHRRPYMLRRHAWMRVLALLVVTALAAGAYVEAHAVDHVAASSESGGGAEHDVLDTALRPPARQEDRPLAPLRPAPHPAPGLSRPARRPRSVPASSVPTPRALRSVVLRC